ncbi:MAG: hypothetical protein KDD38_09840, partial [Bdellovibrionales bacterium]|nr:hypothetical protein [Bdellovibrionales bacterium]
IEGNSELFPKGASFPKPGILTIHIGPVIQPEQVDQINELYKEWALTINPNAYPPEMDIDENDEDIPGLEASELPQAE